MSFLLFIFTFKLNLAKILNLMSIKRLIVYNIKYLRNRAYGLWSRQHQSAQNSRKKVSTKKPNRSKTQMSSTVYVVQPGQFYKHFIIHF